MKFILWEEINDLLKIWQCCQFDCFWKRVWSIYKLGVDFFLVSVIRLFVALPKNYSLLKNLFIRHKLDDDDNA